MTATAEPRPPRGDEAPQRERLEHALARGAEVLSAARSVALACHVNPDADALGSMLGLGQYLAARGKRVVCSYGNQPLSPPRWLSVLDGAGLLVEARDFPRSPEVLVALDTASPDRLGVLAQSAQRAREVVVVDHHRTNAGFGTVLILDPTASSTSELVFRLVERMGGELPAGAAACLYAGIVTDTGRFQYEATTPETLRVAARLRSYPFDHTRIARALFEESSLPALKAAAVALERAVLDPRADLVWTYLLQSDLERVSAGMADTDDFIDLLRTAREADVTCVIKQQPDGRFKVSVRSKGGTDVGSVAAAFGGGGHRLAAGYTSSVGLAETVRRLVEALVARRGGGSQAQAPGDR